MEGFSVKFHHKIRDTFQKFDLGKFCIFYFYLRIFKFFKFFFNFLLNFHIKLRDIIFGIFPRSMSQNCHFISTPPAGRSWVRFLLGCQEIFCENFHHVLVIIYFIFIVLYFASKIFLYFVPSA